MATFVATTLARRSGGTMAFSPRDIAGGVGVLRNVSGLYEGLAPSMSLSVKRQTNNRRTSRMKIVVPQVDDSNPDAPILKREAFAELVISVPDGMLVADVNDLVGYIEKATATAVTNLNAILVNGEGVY